MLFIKILKSRGPRTEPCGTPKEVFFPSTERAFYFHSLPPFMQIAMYCINGNFAESVCFELRYYKFMIEGGSL